MIAPRWSLAQAGTLVALALGCGSSFDGRLYHGDGFTMRVAPAPPGWTQIDVSHAALAFDDASHGGTVLVNGRCDRDGEDVPLKSLTQHLFIHFTEREVHSEMVYPFDGREALRTEITAKLDGVPRKFVVWVMKKDKCVYDLLYLAPPETFPSGAQAFDAWVQEFSASRENGL